MIVIGTRGSALARAQTALVAAALGEHTVRVIHTAGDTSDRPIRELGDGVFTTAIEAALREGAIDVAVHSLKDLPIADAPGLAIAAVPARTDPRDVVITRDRAGVAALWPGARVGTSSVRRAAFLRALAPGIACEEIRGNVDTRLRKVRDGEYDAVVIAAAGLRRLGIAYAERAALAIDDCPPAPGQAALAVQTRGDDPLRERVRVTLDDADTHRAVDAEREVLRLAGASCDIPLGCHATVRDGTITLVAALARESGIRRSRAVGTDPRAVAREAADVLRVLARA